jgi:NADH dehydrogenase (ubiquinone) flavoprotein 2
LSLPPIRVHEVASFYSMYNLQPVGENLVQICHTTPCWLRGSDKLIEACEEHLGVHAYKETTADGKFTLMKVECLGACANAPMMQVNDHFYEDLDIETMKKILDALKRGKQPKTGSQLGRKGSEPVKGRKMGKKVV